VTNRVGGPSSRSDGPVGHRVPGRAAACAPGRSTDASALEWRAGPIVPIDNLRQGLAPRCLVW